jgi:hypothetical protein
MEVKYVAAPTVTALGVGTVCAVGATTAAATTASAVAFGALAVIAGAMSISSMTAWADPKSKNASTYFQNLGNHSLYVVPGAVQFTAQTLGQAAIQGVARGVANNLSRRIGGADHTFEVSKK